MMFGKCPARRQEVTVSGPNKGKSRHLKCKLKKGHSGNHVWG